MPARFISNVMFVPSVTWDLGPPLHERWVPAVGRREPFVEERTGNNRTKRTYANREEYYLYNTCVVTRWKDGNHITLNMYEFDTATTRRAIVEVLREIGIAAEFGRTAVGGNRIIRYGWGVDHHAALFTEGMVIEIGPIFR